MAITVASSEYAFHASGVNWVITKPSGLQVGDLLIVQLTFAYTGTWEGSGFTPPSGWTLEKNVDNSTGSEKGSMWIYSKIATSTETAASNFTFVANVGSSGYAMAARITGHLGSSYIGESSGSSDVGALGSITPTRANNLLMMFFGAFDEFDVGSVTSYSITTSSPGFTEIFDSRDAGPNIGAGAAYAVRPETSATGTGTITTSGYRTDERVGIMLFINAKYNYSVTLSDSQSASESVATPKSKSTTNIDSIAITEEVNAIKEKTKWLNETKPTSDWVNEEK